MPHPLSAAFLRRLSHHLHKGGLVAYPTESCYGIGCLPRHPQALARLVRLKKRPQHKGMIVIGDHIGRLKPLLQAVSAEDEQSLAHIWPARKTFLLPSEPRLPALLRGRGREKLAVRVPDHELARTLCQRLRSPLVSTSCNLSGRRACRRERDVRRQFGRRVWVVGGRVGSAQTPSQIIDWASRQRLR